MEKFRHFILFEVISIKTYDPSIHPSILILLGACIIRTAIVLYFSGIYNGGLIAVEAAIITLFGLCIKKTLRFFFVLILALLTGIQFLSVVSTDNYLSCLAILNASEFDSLGKSSLLKLSSILAAFLVTFTPDLFAEKRFPSLGILLFIIIELFSADLPVHNVFSVFYKTIPYMRNSVPNGDGSEFLKDRVSVEQHTKYVEKGENIILLFQEGESQIVLSEKLTPNVWNLQKKVFHSIIILITRPQHLGALGGN